MSTREVNVRVMNNLLKEVVMAKGIEHKRDGRKKPQLTLKEKHQRKHEKKLAKMVKHVDLI